MSERARRNPELDVWRENIAEELRALFARQRIAYIDAARALDMDQATFSRKMLGKVSFKAEEIQWLMDFMNRNLDEIMAASKKNGTTNLCLSHSDDPDAQNRLTEWARRGYELARRIYGDRRIDEAANAA